MKIDEIIAITNQSYPDGMIAQYWDEKKHRPLGVQAARNVGDGLARFIVQELFETFDAEASDGDQITEAIRVMDSARREIDQIIGAFETKQENLP